LLQRHLQGRHDDQLALFGSGFQEAKNACSSSSFISAAASLPSAEVSAERSPCVPKSPLEPSHGGSPNANHLGGSAQGHLRQRR